MDEEVETDAIEVDIGENVDIQDEMDAGTAAGTHWSMTLCPLMTDSMLLFDGGSSPEHYFRLQMHM